MKKMLVVFFVAFIAMESEGQFIKLMRPNEPPQRFRAASEHKTIQIENEKKRLQTPGGIQHRKNHDSIDPCVVSPCGANTLCVPKHKSHYYSPRVSSRVCYCYYGFIPHSGISETCVRPCDLQYCGGNAYCINAADGKHECICNPGYLPVLHGTSHFEGCGDPCRDFKCNPYKTVCIAKSANERVCLCEEGTVPKNGDAAKYGCETETAALDPCEVKPCTQMNTFCVVNSKMERYCICDEGHIEVEGDAAANGCMPNPCSSKMCGDKAYCINAKGIAHCQCLDGYVVREDQLIETDGCVENPCDPTNPCSGIKGIDAPIPSIYVESLCNPTSPDSSPCACPDNFVPHDGSEDENGCIQECTTDSPCDGDFTTCVGGKCACSGSVEADGSCSDPCSSKMCGDNAFCVTVQGTAICQCLDDFVVGEDQSIESNGCVLNPVAACAAAGGNICTVTETCIIRRPAGVTGCGTLALFRESTTLLGAVDGGIALIGENEELLECYFGEPLKSFVEVYFSYGDDSSNLCKTVKTLGVGLTNGFSLQSGECSNFANDGSAMALCTLP